MGMTFIRPLQGREGSSSLTLGHGPRLMTFDLSGIRLYTAGLYLSQSNDVSSLRDQDTVDSTGFYLSKGNVDRPAQSLIALKIMPPRGFRNDAEQGEAK